MSDHRSGPPASKLAQGLLLAGGITWIYALFVAFSAATGYEFELAGEGTSRGVPLPSTWFHAALFTAVGAAFWLVGRAWDEQGFVALRKRRPWLVPLITCFVILPASLVLLFALVQ
jgi:hypothetical protein